MIQVYWEYLAHAKPSYIVLSFSLVLFLFVMCVCVHTCLFVRGEERERMCLCMIVCRSLCVGVCVCVNVCKMSVYVILVSFIISLLTNNVEVSVRKYRHCNEESSLLCQQQELITTYTTKLSTNLPWRILSSRFLLCGNLIIFVASSDLIHRHLIVVFFLLWIEALTHSYPFQLPQRTHGAEQGRYVALILLPSGFLCLLHLFYGYFVFPEETWGRWAGCSICT